jgi:hypothetical protein
VETFRRKLQEVLAQRCEKNPRYSVRAFARALAIDHSTLSQILRGKRTLSPKAIRELGTRIGIDKTALEAMAIEPAADRASREDAARVLTEPIHRALLELTHLETFHADARWIAKMLDASVDVVNITVARLARVGLLEMSGDRWLDRTEGDFERSAAEKLARAWSASSTRIERKEEKIMGSPVMQFQIIAKDADACARFYGSLFGWKVSADNALGYRQLDTKTDQGIQGGIWPAPPGTPGAVQMFIRVDDVGAYVERARSLGARVVMPPQKLPDGDEMAVLVDPDGLPFGIFH